MSNSAGDAGFDDFGGRPGPLLVVAGLGIGFTAGARAAGALRVVGFGAALFDAATAAFFFSSFSFSRASYSSLEGIFRVIRFKPEVSASTASFSLPFTGPVALA